MTIYIKDSKIHLRQCHEEKNVMDERIKWQTYTQIPYSSIHGTSEVALRVSSCRIEALIQDAKYLIRFGPKLTTKEINNDLQYLFEVKK